MNRTFKITAKIISIMSELLKAQFEFSAFIIQILVMKG